MLRNLRAMTLALFAALAVGAVVSETAEAAGELVAEPVPVIVLKGEQAGEGGAQRFVTTSGSVECNELHFESTKFGGSELTAENISYANSGGPECKGVFGTAPVIEMNGCHYKFNVGETVEAGNPDETKGSVSLTGCNATGHITINATGCVITVPEQVVGPVYFKNNATASPRDLVIEPKIGTEGEATAIKYHHEGFLCGAGERKDGQYTGKATVKATVTWQATVGVK